MPFNISAVNHELSQHIFRASSTLLHRLQDKCQACQSIRGSHLANRLPLLYRRPKVVTCSPCRSSCSMCDSDLAGTITRQLRCRHIFNICVHCIHWLDNYVGFAEPKRLNVPGHHHVGLNALQRKEGGLLPGSHRILQSLPVLCQSEPVLTHLPTSRLMRIIPHHLCLCRATNVNQRTSCCLLLPSRRTRLV